MNSLNKNIDPVRRYTLKFLQYSWNKCTMEILVSIMRFTFYDNYLNQASVQDPEERSCENCLKILL